MEDKIKKEQIKRLAIQAEDAKIYSSINIMRKRGYGKLIIKFYKNKVVQINRLETENICFDKK